MLPGQRPGPRWLFQDRLTGAGQGGQSPHPQGTGQATPGGHTGHTPLNFLPETPEAGIKMQNLTANKETTERKPM